MYVIFLLVNQVSRGAGPIGHGSDTIKIVLIGAGSLQFGPGTVGYFDEK